MCGIVGFFRASNVKPLPRNIIGIMNEGLKHRGPDQSDYFSSLNGALQLAHRRLSIHDLSEAGRQPMTSSCGTYVIVYNGEIYNFLELRKELESLSDISWKGHSDTEVLLELIARWGIENALPKLNGMFSIALFNKSFNTLTLARDRFGEKPLYIFSDDGSIAFSSELKPIEMFTADLTINSAAVSSQLMYSYIPAPHSIYNEVIKLMPGSYLTVKLNQLKKISVEDINYFWDIGAAILSSKDSNQVYANIEDSLVRNEQVLRESVKLRMAADVPLGAFLSGGIDSTCIATLMQQESSRKIKTFSIGFDDHAYNEAEHAKSVANVLGTEHHELYLQPRDMLEFVPSLQEIYDEPFSDSSQLPTLMVSKFAKQSVSVALTGDSGDEVYCGYNRYEWGNKLNKSLRKIPTGFRKCVGSAIRKVSPNTYDELFLNLSKLKRSLAKHNRVGDKLHKFARVMSFSDDMDLYDKLILTSEQSLVLPEINGLPVMNRSLVNQSNLPIAEKMMWLDTIGYMQSDILTKVDRASMAVSLETRIPFLDNHVFNHAWSMPLEHKFYNGESKYPLRHIIRKHIPDQLMDRPKAGFGVPIYDWLRTDLKDWAEVLLSEGSLKSSGLLDVDGIRNIWAQHQSGKMNNQYELWNVLMFQQWYMSKF